MCVINGSRFDHGFTQLLHPHVVLVPIFTLSRGNLCGDLFVLVARFRLSNLTTILCPRHVSSSRSCHSVLSSEFPSHY